MELRRHLNYNSTSNNESTKYNTEFLPIPKLRAIKEDSTTNYATIDFSKLVSYLSSHFINNNLTKILEFLESDNETLSFPSVSSISEAFLIKLIHNYKNFISPAFDTSTLNIGREIFAILFSREDFFKLRYGYERGKNHTSVLIYVKQNTREERSENRSIPLTPPSKAFKTKTTNTRIVATNLNSKDAIKLRTQWLNQTLKFIKDDTQASFESEEMPRDEAEFLYQIIDSYNAESEVGYGFKSLYSPLWEAKEEYSDVFDLSVKYIFTKNTNTRRLLLEKIPNPIHTEHVKMAEQNQLTKNEKKESRKSIEEDTEEEMTKAIIKGVTTPYMLNTLQMLVDFVDDDTRDTIKFINVPEQDTNFLRCVTSYLREPKSVYPFPKECHDIMLNIQDKIKSYLGIWELTWLLKTNKSNIRTGILKKVLTVTEKTEKVSRLKKDLPKADCVTKLNNSSNTSTQSKKSDRPSLNYRQNKKAEDKIENGTLDAIGVNKRHQKLIADLSVPVEIDCAVRMMRRMGWEGGALGARGEGITEPIKPALESKTQAGLGYTTKLKVKLKELRIKVFKELIKLVNSNAERKEIQCSETLCMTEKKHINDVVNALSNGKSVNFDDNEENNLVKDVLKIIECHNVTIVTRFINRSKENMTTIRFQKIGKPNINRQSKPKTINKSNEVTKTKSIDKTNFNDDTQTEMNNDIAFDIINVDFINATIQEVGLDDYFMSLNFGEKARLLHGFRASILLIIKDFFLSDYEVKEYRFTITMRKKYHLFIKSAVASINFDKRICLVSPIEEKLYFKTLKAANGEQLILKMHSNKKKIRLEKVNKNNCKMNEETNNHSVDQSGDQSTNQSDDSDVIFIKNSIPTIVLSDSETDEPDDLNTTDLKKNINVNNAIKTKLAGKLPKNDKAMENNISNDAIASSNCNALLKDKLQGEPSGNTNMVVYNEDDILSEIKELEKAIMHTNLDLPDDDDSDTDFKDNASDTSSNKRPGSSLGASDTKKVKLNAFEKEKLVSIIPIDYPKDKIDLNQAIVIEKLISKHIDEAPIILPLLKCYGIKNGTLIYSCCNDLTYFWLKNIVNSNLDLNIMMKDYTNSYKMILKINTFLQEDNSKIFKRLERYNPGLSTAQWVVIGRVNTEDCIILKIDMDVDSYLYIANAKYSMFFGVDIVRFSIRFEED